jgi:hypothetical protein
MEMVTKGEICRGKLDTIHPVIVWKNDVNSLPNSSPEPFYSTLKYLS